MRRRSTARGSLSPLVLAGWLFADLAAALVVILLAAATDFPPPVPEDEPTATESPTIEPPPVPLGIDLDPIEFQVATDASGLRSGDESAEEDLAEALRAELSEVEDSGRIAGFVITFGYSEDPNPGVSLAKAANSVLFDALPELTEAAVTRNFWSGLSSGDAGDVKFEIYLYVTE